MEIKEAVDKINFILEPQKEEKVRSLGGIFTACWLKCKAKWQAWKTAVPYETVLAKIVSEKITVPTSSLLDHKVTKSTLQWFSPAVLSRIRATLKAVEENDKNIAIDVYGKHLNRCGFESGTTPENLADLTKTFSPDEARRFFQSITDFYTLVQFFPHENTHKKLLLDVINEKIDALPGTDAKTNAREILSDMIRSLGR